jgi:hypothetical protein
VPPDECQIPLVGQSAGDQRAELAVRLRVTGEENVPGSADVETMDEESGLGAEPERLDVACGERGDQPFDGR